MAGIITRGADAYAIKMHGGDLCRNKVVSVVSSTVNAGFPFYVCQSCRLLSMLYGNIYLGWRDLWICTVRMGNGLLPE